jgi:hypothetical protein
MDYYSHNIHMTRIKITIFQLMQRVLRRVVEILPE